MCNQEINLATWPVCVLTEGNPRGTAGNKYFTVPRGCCFSTTEETEKKTCMVLICIIQIQIHSLLKHPKFEEKGSSDFICTTNAFLNIKNLFFLKKINIGIFNPVTTKWVFGSMCLSCSSPEKFSVNFLSIQTTQQCRQATLKLPEPNPVLHEFFFCLRSILSQAVYVAEVFTCCKNWWIFQLKELFIAKKKNQLRSTLTFGVAEDFIFDE